VKVRVYLPAGGWTDYDYVRIATVTDDGALMLVIEGPFSGRPKTVRIEKNERVGEIILTDPDLA
jgi:hypothetical protein